MQFHQGLLRLKNNSKVTIFSLRTIRLSLLGTMRECAGHGMLDRTPCLMTWNTLLKHLESSFTPTNMCNPMVA